MELLIILRIGQWSLNEFALVGGLLFVECVLVVLDVFELLLVLSIS